MPVTVGVVMGSHLRCVRHTHPGLPGLTLIEVGSARRQKVEGGFNDLWWRSSDHYPDYPDYLAAVLLVRSNPRIQCQRPGVETHRPVVFAFVSWPPNQSSGLRGILWVQMTYSRFSDLPHPAPCISPTLHQTLPEDRHPCCWPGRAGRRAGLRALPAVRLLSRYL